MADQYFCISFIRVLDLSALATSRARKEKERDLGLNSRRLIKLSFLSRFLRFVT